ncbi:MAG: cysteine desulfurase [Phycisphaerales bacterium]|nr:cysteine desulfurase [Phycisphaerales bacterium]
MISLPKLKIPPQLEGELDIARIRADFPILQQRVHGRPLVYLDNAATTQKPRQVIEAVARYYNEDNANVHRGVHTLSMRATESYENARRTVQRFIGAEHPEEIIFTRGATEAINLVAQAYARPRLRSGDEILISAMEHHSNIVPWQMVCEQTGARLRVIPINDAGELLMDEYASLITPRTRLVAVVHLSNALGTINPLKRIIELAHARNVPVLVDAAQSAAHLPIEVNELDCDFLAFSGHKLYGPTGIGVLYGRKEILAEMPPYQGGGDMILSVRFERTIYNELPYKFEAGTPNIAGAVGLAAAIDYIERIGRENIAAYENRLLDEAIRKLSDIRELKFIGTAAERAAVLSFILEDIHPHDIGTILDGEGIAIRTGHHCAQPVMERLSVPATARASLAFYNTTEEIDVLVQGIRRVLKVLG